MVRAEEEHDYSAHLIIGQPLWWPLSLLDAASAFASSSLLSSYYYYHHHHPNDEIIEELCSKNEAKSLAISP